MWAAERGAEADVHTSTKRKRPLSVFGAASGREGRELESDKESDGRLCQVSEFIEVECVQFKVGNFVYEPAIFRADTKVLRDIEIGATAIYESASCLAFRSGHDELLCRIEYQRSTSAQDIRPDASRVNRNVRD